MQYVIAFLEGVITFVSPCLLPMLPIYISYFAGGGERTTGKTLKGALGFVAGFTVVFVMLGALAGTVGSLLREYQTVVNIVSGLIVVFFGLNYLGVFKLNLFRGGGKSVKTDNMVTGMCRRCSVPEPCRARFSNGTRCFRPRWPPISSRP